MESTPERVSDCLERFRGLCSALWEIKHHGDDVDQVQLDEIPITKVEDELRRFKVWVGNIGAHRTGRSSMDYRLRDASHIRQQVFKLLKDLAESLTDGKHIPSSVIYD